MTTAAHVLSVARSQLGTRETRSGWTKYGAWYNKPGFEFAPWCDMFVSWCAVQAGAADIIGRFAYTPSHAEWFRSHGRWGHMPRVGAIVFYDWSGTENISAIDHVGFVEARRSDGTIVTIEGNTSNAVMRRVRSTANVAGYGYPAYADVSSKPSPSKPTDDWLGVIVSSLPTIRRGDTGAVVRTAQGLLCARVHTLMIDGEFGAVTDLRVRSFQGKKGLAKDGIIGPVTWRRLILG